MTTDNQAPTQTQPSPPLALSRSFCHNLTKRHARNFYYGLKLLPEPKRSAMYALYAYMRLVDDIADEPDARPLAQRQTDLESFRQQTHHAIAGHEIEPSGEEKYDLMWPAFQELVRTYHIPPRLFDAMIDGQLQDLLPVEIDTFQFLYDYCYRVASVVGLASLYVWGFTGGQATEALAVDRGIAFQLTNILRDLREDARRNRIYLPRDELARFAVTPETLQSGTADPRFLELMRFQIARAADYYRRSAPLEKNVSPDSVPTLAAMTRIYSSLLEKIARDPACVLRRRVRLHPLAKLWIALNARRTAFRLAAVQTTQPAAASLAAVQRTALTPPLPSKPADSVGGGNFTPAPTPLAFPAITTPSQNPLPSASIGGSPSAPGGSPSSSIRRVIVVGGGLAGIACSLALAQAGIEVVLLESRRGLGGRASSFEDPQTGELLDNCQHVLLGCCTNLLDLYRRMGVQNKIHFFPAVHFLDAHGRQFNLSGIAALPAPLHLALSMAAFGALSLAERLAVSRAMFAMLRLGPNGRNSLDNIPFGDWLDHHRQPPGVIKKFYDPILVSALNEETRRASAKYAIHVFQEAMLANFRGYPVGLPACPLEELYAKLSGVAVRTQTRVSEIIWQQRGGGAVAARAQGVQLLSGEQIFADALVIATNYHSLDRWIPESYKLSDSRFAGLNRLENVPILGAHLWFDRPVMNLPFAALIDGPLQWLFRKDDSGCVLHGVISAARGWENVPKPQALEQFTAQVRQVLPRARQATLQRGLIVIEKRATFSPLPGSDAFRPAQEPPEGGIANLFLAGDYTQTGWPSTMEGAVRSGYLAAQKILAQAGISTAKRILVDDLPAQWPSRWLSR